MKKALLIGISIGGFLYEMKHISELLINNYGYRKEDITILCDNGQTKLPTYKEIIRELNQIVKISSSCDEIWIYYSGHGFMGGSIITYDKNFVTKTTIYEHIANIKCKAFIMFDCCNSGSIGAQLEWKFEVENDNLATIHNHHWKIMNSNIMVLCSCSEYETSKEIFDTENKIHQGAFTTAFLNVLNSCKSNRISILNLFTKICKEIRNMGINHQTPILSCTTAEPVFILERQKPVVSIQKSIMNNFRALNSRMGLQI